VIQTDTASKERTRLLRSIVLALRELMSQREPDAATRDLAAYLALALLEIDKTVEASVIPWEKRDYWVKADKFRMEWSWAQRSSAALSRAVLDEDWGKVAQTAAQVAMKVNSVKVPQRHGLGTPWVGAYDRLRSS
jgi:hypothetical protein